MLGKSKTVCKKITCFQKYPYNTPGSLFPIRQDLREVSAASDSDD